MQAYLKAIYGAAVAALAATSAALVQNDHIGWKEGVVIASSALAALGVIWAVPNKPSSPSSTQP